ncbi:MAG: AAA family ATPase [Sphaerochaetaceae bacterium]
MGKKYWIEQITIERTPGFPKGFPPIEKFSDALNVIWGPNGVGKTTLANALRSLLWNTAEHTTYAASAVVQGDSETWSVVRDRKVLRQTRIKDNQEMPLPGRNDVYADSYWFALADLIRIEQRNQPFHALLYKELQGGVDLEKAVGDAGALSAFANRNAKEVKRVVAAKEKLDTSKKLQGEVEGLRKTIDALQQQVDQQEHLERQRDILGKALELVSLTAQIDTLVQQLQQFPPQIKFVDALSYKRLQDLKIEYKAKSDRIEELSKTIERKQRDFNQCAITDEQLHQVSLSTKLEELLTQLADASTRLASSDRALKQAETAVGQWMRHYGWLTSEVPDQNNLQSYIERLKNLAQECEPLRCTVAVHQQLVQQLGEKETIDGDRDTLNQLRLALPKYITADMKAAMVQGTNVVSASKKWKVLALSTLIAIVFSILAVVVHPACSFGSLLAVMVMLWSITGPKSGATEWQLAENARISLQTEIRQLVRDVGYPDVIDWQPKTIEELLRRIEKHIIRLEATDERNNRRQQAQTSLQQSRDELESWCDRWEHACQDIGLDKVIPRLEGSQFYHFSHHLHQWVSSVSEVEIKKAEYEIDKSRFVDVIARLKATLLLDTDDPGTLEVEATSVLKRLERAISLNNELAELYADLATATDAYETKGTELTRFFIELGIDNNDELLVQHLSEKKKDWDDIHNQIRYKQHNIEEIESSYPKSIEIAHSTTELEIKSKLETVLSDLKVINDSNFKLGETQAKYDMLTEGTSLAQAELEYRKALDELEMLRQEQLLGRTVQLLVDQMVHELDDTSLPEEIRCSSGWFERITNNQFQLRINKDGFFAHDNVNVKNFTLEQLSSATRVQLLFAVRMGIIEIQERHSGVQLPLFMDELLANSDDERSGAIIRAVREIAKERQVFYFTAQADEVEKFKHLAPGIVHELPLETLFVKHAVAMRPLVPFPYIGSTVPELVDDYEEYGKILDVSAPLLWDPIERMHVWYLFDTSNQVHEQLEHKGTHVGSIAGFEDRIDLLKRAQSLAQYGRPQPVSIQDLKDADLDINQHTEYWKAMEEYVNTNGGDGKRLAEALDSGEIKRVPQKAKDLIIGWLYEHKHIDESSAMNANEILDILLKKVDNFSRTSDDYKIVARYLHHVIAE